MSRRAIFPEGNLYGELLTWYIGQLRLTTFPVPQFFSDRVEYDRRIKVEEIF